VNPEWQGSGAPRPLRHLERRVRSAEAGGRPPVFTNSGWASAGGLVVGPCSRAECSLRASEHRQSEPLRRAPRRASCRPRRRARPCRCPGGRPGDSGQRVGQQASRAAGEHVDEGEPREVGAVHRCPIDRLRGARARGRAQAQGREQEGRNDPLAPTARRPARRPASWKYPHDRCGEGGVGGGPLGLDLASDVVSGENSSPMIPCRSDRARGRSPGPWRAAWAGCWRASGPSAARLNLLVAERRDSGSHGEAVSGCGSAGEQEDHTSRRGTHQASGGWLDIDTVGRIARQRLRWRPSGYLTGKARDRRHGGTVGAQQAVPSCRRG